MGVQAASHPAVAEGALAPSSHVEQVRVAIVDRDSGLRQVLVRRLQDIGWPHTHLVRPPSPRELVLLRPGALILDLDLAGPARWSYLDRVVETLPSLPIVICTRPWSVADRVRALRAGADDWIAKPCHPDELLARVQAAVRARRRHQPSSEPRVIRAGELEIHPHTYGAHAAGRDLELTRREFELLHLLAAADGRVLEREDIYRQVWRYEMAHGDRSVDVYVRKLRQKLEQASPRWQYIHTRIGVGYGFSAEPEID